MQLYIQKQEIISIDGIHIKLPMPIARKLEYLAKL
jgi:hypothetical protein